jgi:hypothetical protein
MNINVSTGSGNDFNEVCRFNDYHKIFFTLSAATSTTAGVGHRYHSTYLLIGCNLYRRRVEDRFDGVKRP